MSQDPRTLKRRHGRRVASERFGNKEHHNMDNEEIKKNKLDVTETKRLGETLDSVIGNTREDPDGTNRQQAAARVGQLRDDLFKLIAPTADEIASDGGDEPEGTTHAPTWKRIERPTFNELQHEAWQIAEDSGFHDERVLLELAEHTVDRLTDAGIVDPTDSGDVLEAIVPLTSRRRGRAEALALIHSEVTEALEADRVGDDEAYAEELADIVIRVMDHAHSEGIALDEEIMVKNRKNSKRAHKHGKRY